LEGTVVDVWQKGPRKLVWESGPKPLKEDRVHSYFRLDDDLEAICEAIGDAKVRAAFDRYPGLRLLRQDPWETLVSFVISQMSNVPRISTTVETLATHYGDHLGDGVSSTFPSPDQLAQADEAALRLLGLGYRAPHLVYIANAVADGQVFLEPLRFRPYEEAETELTRLPGVGPKVADCCLLFSLDHLEAFPVDRWVGRAMAEWYGLDEAASPRAMAEWARERFGKYAGYAGQYLFHSRREGGKECPGPPEGQRDRNLLPLAGGDADLDG